MGELVFLGMFNTFITIYYNQALGLANSLIGIAIMLAMVGDAISDPVVGMISDRWHSRLGRRHPFLLAAPLPLAISLYFIFSPPEIFIVGQGGEPVQILLFMWLACWTIAARIFLTLYTIPHHALGGELTQEEAWRGLRAVMFRAFPEMERTLKAHDLLAVHYHVLAVLSNAPDQTLRLTELADSANMSQSRLTHRLRVLVERGEGAISDDPDDRRAKNATLTAAGRKRLEHLAPIHIH